MHLRSHPRHEPPAAPAPEIADRDLRAIDAARHVVDRRVVAGSDKDGDADRAVRVAKLQHRARVPVILHLEPAARARRHARRRAQDLAAAHRGAGVLNAEGPMRLRRVPGREPPCRDIAGLAAGGAHLDEAARGNEPPRLDAGEGRQTAGDGELARAVVPPKRRRLAGRQNVMVGRKARVDRRRRGGSIRDRRAGRHRRRRRRHEHRDTHGRGSALHDSYRQPASGQQAGDDHPDPPRPAPRWIRKIVASKRRWRRRGRARPRGTVHGAVFR